MDIDELIERLIDDFIFLDSRLSNHPKVKREVNWTDGDFANSPSKKLPSVWKRRALEEIRINLHLVGEQFAVAWGLKRKEGLASLEINLHLHLEDYCELDMYKKNFLGTFHLLAYLLVLSNTYKLGKNLRHKIGRPYIAILGEYMRNLRQDIGFSQAELAKRLCVSNISVSRWESGKQQPAVKALYDWCKGLGILSSKGGTLVRFANITPKLLQMLKKSPEELRKFSPEGFEHLVAERLDCMGYDVTLTGKTSMRDGGIDLIAVPKVRTLGTFLIAGQVKHHKTGRKTGRAAVDRLLSWRDSDFRLGLLVTNTTFTRHAKWVASRERNRAFLRLRDFEDLRRWLEDNFCSEEDWCEIPHEIMLAPDIVVPIPKPKTSCFRDLWPPPPFDL